MYFISIILAIRDGEDYIKYLNNNFLEIEEKYKDTIKFEYYIYENDSIDNTKKEVQLFYKNRLGKYFIGNVPGSKTMSGINLERGLKMANLRNNIKQFHGILKSDYVLWLDGDSFFCPESIKQLINSINSKENIAMVTSFCMCYGAYIECGTLDHYYDSLALITNNNISYKETTNTCPFLECERCKELRKKRKILLNNKYYKINIPDSALISNKIINSVKSAFGGFAFIKTEIYNKCKWDGSNTPIEHPSLCENIRQYGDIIIDPTIKTFAIPITFPIVKNYKEIHNTLKSIIKDLDKSNNIV
jgi:hypothetical protein